jgi:ketosteroid isomerase-like protein
VTENDTVVVIGFESGIITATGHPFRNEWVQKYVVQDDLITEMEEYNIPGGCNTVSASAQMFRALECADEGPSTEPRRAR